MTAPAFPNSPLQEVDPAAVMLGDLAIYSLSASDVGHIVMIHDIGADETVHTIEATPSRGVHIGTIDWAGVIRINRPPAPKLLRARSSRSDSARMRSELPRRPPALAATREWSVALHRGARPIAPSWPVMQPTSAIPRDTPLAQAVR